MGWYAENKENVVLALNVIGLIAVIALLAYVYLYPQGKEFLVCQQHSAIINYYDNCTQTPGFLPVLQCKDTRPDSTLTLVNWTVAT